MLSSPFQFKIVGLDRGDNGRHCKMHVVTPCGESIAVGDYVSITFETLDNGDDSVKVFKIENGMKTCHVTFLNKFYLKSTFVSNILNRVSKVVEIHKVIQNNHKRWLNCQHRGVALVETVEIYSIMHNPCIAMEQQRKRMEHVRNMRKALQDSMNRRA